MSLKPIYRAGPFFNPLFNPFATEPVSATANSLPVNCAFSDEVIWPWRYFTNDNNDPRYLYADPTQTIEHSATSSEFPDFQVRFAYQAAADFQIYYNLSTVSPSGIVGFVRVRYWTRDSGHIDIDFSEGSGNQSVDGSGTLPASASVAFVALEAVAGATAENDATAQISFSLGPVP